MKRLRWVAAWSLRIVGVVLFVIGGVGMMLCVWAEGVEGRR